MLCELFAAVCTHVGPLAGVCPHVFAEIARLCEAFSTSCLRTYIRFFACVNSHVQSEVELSRKTFVAFLAYIWHVSGVTSHVVGKVPLLDKLFGTLGADVGLLAGVHSCIVRCEAAMFGKLLSAITTDVRFFSSVRPHVHFEHTQELASVVAFCAIVVRHRADWY